LCGALEWKKKKKGKKICLLNKVTFFQARQLEVTRQRRKTENILFKFYYSYKFEMDVLENISDIQAFVKNKLENP